MKKKKLIIGLFLVLGIFTSVYLYADMEANPPGCDEVINSVCKSGTSECSFSMVGDQACFYADKEQYFIND